MGGVCDPRNLQHHAIASQGLRQRGSLPDSLLPVRRGLRDQLRRPKGKVPEATRHCAAETLTFSPELIDPPHQSDQGGKRGANLAEDNWFISERSRQGYSLR